jgi:hypothetical protein
MSLNPRAARVDLTDREIAKLVCGVLGGISQMAPPEEIRKALDWILANWEAVSPTFAAGYQMGCMSSVDPENESAYIRNGCESLITDRQRRKQ